MAGVKRARVGRREIEARSEIGQSADALEGRKAFVEKRKAQFDER